MAEDQQILEAVLDLKTDVGNIRVEMMKAIAMSSASIHRRLDRERDDVTAHVGGLSAKVEAVCADVAELERKRKANESDHEFVQRLRKAAEDDKAVDRAVRRWKDTAKTAVLIGSGAVASPAIPKVWAWVKAAWLRWHP